MWPRLLEPAPKAPDSFDRMRALGETLALLPRVRERFGITRVADLTHLDRIGIPVYSAIVPHSREEISVYNGKGATREAALVSAVMEAAERQLGATPPGLEPDDESMLGYDLIGRRTLAVPAHSVCSTRLPPPPDKRTSSGLASGNTLVEAVYHALCELIERHAWSIADALGHRRPLAMLASFAGTAISVPGFVDDPVAIELSEPTGSAVLDDLLDRVHAARCSAHVRAVDLPPLPITFVATIAGEGRDGPRAYNGFGCSLSPEHAAIRALTEAAQSRLFDISATREDLLRPDDPTPPFGAGNRRGAPSLPRGRWYFDVPAPARRLDDFADRSSPDVGRDVVTLVDALATVGIEHAVIVDLSPPDLPIAVVRAIVPDLETTVIDGRIGPTIAAILDLERVPPLRLPAIAER